MGARVVLGLRDVLDQSARVRAEVRGRRWKGVPAVFDEALVYGAASFCDHHAEYDIPLPIRYCGWVVEVPERARHERRHLVVTSGGGGDGRGVLKLGIAVAERSADWRVTIAAGHYVDVTWLERLVMASPARDRVTIVPRAPGCATLFATAAATLQMAGYNSTFEAIAAGRRPILVPRQSPRVEQAIRAQLLAARELADVVDLRSPDAVRDLLGECRTVAANALRRAGIDFRGAERAADVLTGATTVPGVPAPVCE
jgi:predicted glycosyltransferase